MIVNNCNPAKKDPVVCNDYANINHFHINRYVAFHDKEVSTTAGCMLYNLCKKQLLD